MPGYSDSLQKKISPYGYTVSYNPEFIAQGTIMDDLLKPDIVLIGEANSHIGSEIKKIYQKIITNNPIYHHMSRKEAEITKIALNCFVTTISAFPTFVIALNDKFTIPVGPANCASNKTPFIDRAT